MPNINHDVTCLKDVKDYNKADALDILNQLIAKEDYTTNHVVLEALEYVKEVIKRSKISNGH